MSINFNSRTVVLMSHQRLHDLRLYVTFKTSGTKSMSDCVRVYILENHWHSVFPCCFICFGFINFFDNLFTFFFRMVSEYRRIPWWCKTPDPKIHPYLDSDCLTFSLKHPVFLSEQETFPSLLP